MDGGDSTKVESAKKGTDRTEMRKEEKRLKCTLLKGSAWSTEKKYMRRYKGTFDISFGIEHRLWKDEMEGAVKPRGKGRIEVCGRRGGESRMEEQAAWVKSIHQEEFLWQSTAIWEQLLERKKEQLRQSQEIRKSCPGLGKCTWRDANVCSILLAHGGLVPKKWKLSWKRC